MAMAGLYRRILPSPPAIDFASAEGKQLFVEAIQNGTMESFFKLISYFQTQSEPAYCGLASLSMVLNALAIDPGRKWKGPWRWFDESMLDCCEPLEKVKANGIAFGKVACLARCAGAKVEAFRTTQSTVDDFRKYVMQCSTSDTCHLISSYHRGSFRQTGAGHFSPIGGYHAGRDMALILDVARFKYPPHWVPLPLLWEAMDTVDEATGLHRGFMLISGLHRAPALLYTLSCKHESWVSIAKYLTEEVPMMLASYNAKGIKDILVRVFASLPGNFADFIKWVAEVRRQEDAKKNLSEEEKGRLAVKEEVLKQVQETGLYKHVTDLLCSEKLYRINPTFSHVDNLPNIAASVCCQGAGLLAGKFSSLDIYCCRETCVRCYRANGDRPVTVVSGTVVNSNGEQEIDIIVPSLAKLCCCNWSSDCCRGKHPHSNDVLTALLLALPPETWSGIKDEKVLQEIHSLLSAENLPLMLQEEILHLRDQLFVLERCKDGKVSYQEPSNAFQRLQSVTKDNRAVSQRLSCSLKQIPFWENNPVMSYSSSRPLLCQRGPLFRIRFRKESMYPTNFMGRNRFRLPLLVLHCICHVIASGSDYMSPPPPPSFFSWAVCFFIPHLLKQRGIITYLCIDSSLGASHQTDRLYYASGRGCKIVEKWLSSFFYRFDPDVLFVAGIGMPLLSEYRVTKYGSLYKCVERPFFFFCGDKGVGVGTWKLRICECL